MSWDMTYTLKPEFWSVSSTFSLLLVSTYSLRSWRFVSFCSFVMFDVLVSSFLKMDGSFGMDVSMEPLLFRTLSTTKSFGSGMM